LVVKKWLLGCALSCSDPALAPSPKQDAGITDAEPNVDDAGGGPEDAPVPPIDPKPVRCDGGTAQRVRVMAANISSGSAQSYTEGSGARLFKALAPDIVMIQEFNYAGNTDSDILSFVNTTFGAPYVHVRGPGGQIPNGIISRYPILESGSWIDPQVSNRTFMWAKLDVPGAVDLWAVSVHLLTTGSTDRRNEARALASAIRAKVPAGDYVTLGGDFNTDNRAEPLVGELEPTVSFQGPYPRDQAGNENTSGPRSKPYDWVVGSSSLAANEVPVELAGQNFVHGLVFDTRVFSPLAPLMPPLNGQESVAANMQHMPVVRDFVLACE
jgi:endonuclease/exonuclease/phosphatase family metal-dependent hydrolase